LTRYCLTSVRARVVSTECGGLERKRGDQSSSQLPLPTEVGVSRQSLIWFRDLVAKSIGGPEGAAQFLEGVFRDLWQPEMVEFVSHQVRRQVGREGYVLDSDVARDGLE
jgi:hypothetical protein